MLEAFWAQNTDAGTGMGPFSWLCCCCGTGKASCSNPGLFLAKVRLAERSRRQNAPSPQHCQPWAIPQLLDLPSDKHRKQSRTGEVQGQWDERG